jgi:XTP/dITP diphosphohydrolase
MIIASNNKGKIKQFKQIFGDIELTSLKEAGVEVDVEEDAETFLGNAIKKAKAIYDITKQPTIADDSGMCIDYLNGAPGVMTHRFLGDNVTAEERNAWILNELKDVPYEKRGAKIYCALAVCDSEGNVTSVCEYVERKIAFESKGDNFFGFDSITLIEEGVTAAMLTDEQKNQVSARRKACEKLKEVLAQKGSALGENEYK